MGNKPACGSASPGDRTEPFAGVVLFTKSLEDLKVVEWACRLLRPSRDYKLCVIHVTELKGTNPPPETQSAYESHEMETMFINAGYPRDDIKKHHNCLHAIDKDIWNYIWGKKYNGDNFEQTLQDAIKELRVMGLDKLVLQLSDDPQRTPVKRLESQGCSIVLANVAESSTTGTNNHVLTLRTPDAAASTPTDDDGRANVDSDPTRNVITHATPPPTTVVRKRNPSKGQGQVVALAQSRPQSRSSAKKGPSSAAPKS